MEIIIISCEKAYSQEIEIINTLFSLGLEKFHLRKKEISSSDQELFIKKIDKQYHSKIHIHQHYHHADMFSLAGIHIKSNVECDEQLLYNKSKSCHSFIELEKYKHDYSYLFISPVFNSISKKGYNSGFQLGEISLFLKKAKIYNSYALGGICLANVELLKYVGFRGVALLGCIWNKKTKDEIYNEFSNMKKILDSY